MSSNLSERRYFRRAASLVASVPAQFAGIFARGVRSHIRLQQIAEMMIFIDADEHEPIAAVLRDNNGFAQGNIAKLRKFPDEFT